MHATRYTSLPAYDGQAVGGVAARRPPSISLLCSLLLKLAKRGCPLFDDFYDLTAARLDNHGQIVHDRIAVTRPHVILARHRVERYPSGQHRAEPHIARVPDRGREGARVSRI